MMKYIPHSHPHAEQFFKSIKCIADIDYREVVFHTPTIFLRNESL